VDAVRPTPTTPDAVTPGRPPGNDHDHDEEFVMSAHRPFDQALIARLDSLSEDLRAEAKPRGDGVRLPLPGGDPALLEASADAATLLARLLAAIVAFDHGQEDKAEDLIQSTGMLVDGVRANTGV
jgi:hypothetical protein